jgi:hypothetical protein
MIKGVAALDQHHDHGCDHYRISEKIHCGVGLNGIFGPHLRARPEHSLLNMYD